MADGTPVTGYPLRGPLVAHGGPLLSRPEPLAVGQERGEIAEQGSHEGNQHTGNVRSPDMSTLPELGIERQRLAEARLLRDSRRGGGPAKSVATRVATRTDVGGFQRSKTADFISETDASEPYGANS